MKIPFRSAVRWLKGVPFIGPLIAIPLSIYRLPLLYKRLASLDERLAHLEASLAHLQATLGVSGHQTETVPTNSDIQNLILSTPIALRKLRRDVDLLLRHVQIEATDPHASVSKAINE